jgi:hypothetical protein
MVLQWQKQPLRLNTPVYGTSRLGGPRRPEA